MTASLTTNAVASSSSAGFCDPSLSSSTQSLVLPPKPVQELWYQDGNLVLEAEGRHFKIFGGLLAARSSVFADMLAFPPPPEGERDPTIDGCAVVHVYDSAADLAYFLRAVFDSSFFEPPPRPTTFPTVSAILRLSLKYDVPFLTRRALAHLDTTFPTARAAWHARDATRTIPALENTPFVVLQLARECHAEWLIPSVAYCVCSHPFAKTLDGAVVNWTERVIGEEDGQEDDGSSDSASSSGSSTSDDADDDTPPTSDDEDSSESKPPPTMGALLYTGPKRQKLVLSWSDRRALIVGRQRLLAMQSKAALAVLKCGAPEVPPPPPPPSVMPSAFVSYSNTPLGTPPVAGVPAPGNNAGDNTNATVPNHTAVNGLLSPPQFALNPAAPVPPVPMAPFPAAQHVGDVANANTAPPTPAALAHANSYFTLHASSSSSSLSSLAPAYNLPLLLLTHCPTPTACALARLRCADTLVAWDIAALLDYFADNAEVYKTGFCKACWDRFEGVCKEEAGKMWDGLPGAFGVDGGEDVVEGEAEGEDASEMEGVSAGWRAVEKERRRAMAE